MFYKYFLDCNLERLFEGDLLSPYFEQVNEFREQLTKVKKGSISTLLPNAHVSCGILKRYFDELKTPILSFGCIKECKDKSETEQYGAIVEALQKLPKPNQNLFAYLVNFCYRLQRKQATLTPELLSRALAPHIIRDESPGKFNQRAVDLLKIVLRRYNDHFPKGTSIPVPPPAATVSIYDDDDTPGGFIAVRVNNYQVTALMSMYDKFNSSSSFSYSCCTRNFGNSFTFQILKHKFEFSWSKPILFHFGFVF